MSSKIKIIILTLLTFTYSSWSSFSEEFSLMSNDGQKGEYFGHAVAISGNHAIVGAYGAFDNTGVRYSGAVYCYYNDNEKWLQLQKIIPNESGYASQYGFSVSIFDKTAVVGSNFDKDKGYYSGAVYIYEFDEEIMKWIFKQKIYANDPSESSRFGSSVSIYGNYLLVGAIYDRENGLYSGSVYLFTKTENGWHELRKLTAYDGKQGDVFGCSVSISNNYALVGAFQSSECSGKESGSIYFFEKFDGSFRFLQKVCSSDAGLGDHFGCSVSLNDDYAVVGANKNNGGAAYIFKNIDNTWSEILKLNATNNNNGNFGCAVSISSSNIIVGDYIYNAELGTALGQTYLYSLFNNNWEYQTTLKPKDSEYGDLFGSSVALSENSIIVGALGKNDSTGKAYIYSDLSSGLKISGYLKNYKNEPIQNAKIESASKHTTTSDESGFFSLTVPFNFCGNISIYMNDYVLPSTIKQYTSVRDNIVDHNFVLEQYSISGSISDIQNNPISGVEILFSNGGGISTTNLYGFFTHEVYKGWAGTIIPSGRGYNFTPSYVSFNNISSNSIEQLFKGSKLSISGFVTDKTGNPVEGVELVLSNNIKNGTVITDQYGFYIHEIDKDWTGYIIPEKDTCTFNPSYTPYTAVTKNFNNQNYNCVCTSPIENTLFPDANNDGIINLKDLIDILKYLTNIHK